MNINFELYKVFYEVANERSISKGAEKLLISQPAVTQSIKTLESELGGQLFIRTPKGVVLTNEGQILYNYISEGMRYFLNGTNKFTSLKELSSGTISIGATTIISEQYLMPYLKEFIKSKVTPYMVPSFYMKMDEFPLNPNGKIDVKALPTPEFAIEEIIEPETDIEIKLFEIIF